MSAGADADWQRLSAGDVTVYVTRGYETAARALGLLEPGGIDAWLARASGPGRAGAASAPLPGGGRLHLRPVVHGGALARLRGGWLWGVRRPLAELEAGALLARRGAPVARPVLVASRRRLGPFASASVGTLLIEGARDGAALLAARPSPARIREAAAAAGEAVRRFHDAGGRHADLHAGNLVFREGAGGLEAFVVDLDRARVSASVPPGRRMAEIMRLYRSLAKRGTEARAGARGAAAFLRAYTRGERGLRRALLAHLPRERARLAAHRAGYRLARRGAAGS